MDAMTEDAIAVAKVFPHRKVLATAVIPAHPVSDFLASLAAQIGVHNGVTMYVQVAGGRVLRVTVEEVQATWT